LNGTNEIGLVLASTSRYRHELLARLDLPFRSADPDLDERPRPGEQPVQLATRLAREKAQSVARKHPGALVIGSDQVADLDGVALGKPGNAVSARRQLNACSGRPVVFHTALCVLDTRGAAPRCLESLDRTSVVFRVLEAAEIARYVGREQPFDCAGSFRCEGLGVALFERIATDDPTALIGLPLIGLARLLRAAGVEVI
jgi:septum formation protein